MSGLRYACAAIAALGGVAPSTFAEDPPLIEHPKFFIFMEGTPCNYTYSQEPNERPVAPFTKQKVSIFLGHPNGQPTLTGAQAANFAADYILRHTQESSWALEDQCYGTADRPPDLDPTNICITFNGFGRDFRDVDCDAGYCDPFYANSDLRFFTEDDRLANYL